MCGIAGILLGPHAADPRRLTAITAMTASLRHRGPDGDGFWVDPEAGLALGHRRLAIVDLSEAGRQPMTSHSENFVTTFNGEIYNFRDLRTELEIEGHSFRGHSDTEVMLAAFETWGIEPALRRFAGMFAIALWNRRDRVLRLIRDRLGKKPLYVTVVDGALAFASELKSLYTLPGFCKSLNPRALALMLRQGWIPDQHCIWDGVLKVPPGAMLSIRADELSLAGTIPLRERFRRWWSLAQIAETGQREPSVSNLQDVEAELETSLNAAVRERMIADVPLGALLSGGIDSTTVVAIMQAQSTQQVRTFTIGFIDDAYDEGRSAANIARYLGTSHTELRVTPETALATIPQLPRIWDEPFADESQIPTLLVAQLAREHVTVALSGDGGDECFGGYTRHALSQFLTPLLKLPPGIRRIGARCLLALSANAWEALLRRLPLSAGLHAEVSAEQLQKLAYLLDAADGCDLYERLVSVGRASTMLDQGLATTAAVAESAPFLRDPASQIIYRDSVGYLPGDILVKLDRASMAVSLETRCPLLDHRLIEVVWRLPISMKIHRGESKWLLRRVLRRYVPERLFARPKHGFNVPIGAWLKGPLRDWAEQLIAGSRLASEGFLDPVRVQACWREHLEGRRDRAGALWAVLMFQAWLEETRKTVPATLVAQPSNVRTRLPQNGVLAA
jgi:asparagine synthase (glutamine-hydrolysing)